MSDENLSSAELAKDIKPIAERYVQTNCDFITKLLFIVKLLKELSKSVSSGLPNPISNSVNETVSDAIKALLRYVYGATELTQSHDDSAEKEIMGRKLPEVPTPKEFNKIPAAGLLKELSESVLSGLPNPISNSANEAVSDAIKASLTYVYGAAELTQSRDDSAEKEIMGWKLPEVLTPEEFNNKILAAGLLRELSKSVSSDLSNLIPNYANEVVSVAIEASLSHAYDAAEFTQSRDDSAEKEIMGWKLPEVLRLSKRKEFNEIAAAVIGAIGGAGALPGTIVELPVTIGLIFREIQLVSKDYKMNRDMVKRECLSVFLLGTSLEDDKITDSEFIVPKIELQVPTKQCLITEIVPQLVKMLAPKLVSPPVAGVANAVFNLIYIKHYHELAHVKFGLAKLSRRNDAEVVRAEFRRQVEEHRVGCR